MKALVTDNVHEVLLSDLNNAGYEINYLPNIEQNEVEDIIAEYEVLIINSKINVNKVLIDKAVQLKYVGRLGSGLEIVDLDYAALKGIKVYNSPEGNRDAVAEHAIGMLLCLFNQINLAHQDVLNMDWNREARRGEELMGKTIGLIGFGNTGKALAKKLSGFDVEVLFYDKYLKDASNEYAQQVSLEVLKKKADVISLHLPYNKETHYFLNENFIKEVEKNFYLINTSRGKVVNTVDLKRYVKKGRVLGICLDVFENEKTSTYSIEEKDMLKSLLKYPNAVFTPHIAGWTNQSKYKLAKILSKKILSLSLN